MKYIFKNLSSEATFEEFREEHLKVFGDDYFQFFENIPEGKIKDAKNEFLCASEHIEMWIDDGNDTIEYV